MLQSKMGPGCTKDSMCSKTTCFTNIASHEMQCLLNCMAVCRACAKMCMDEGNKKLAMLCLECADMCDTASKLCACNSPFTNQMMDLCAQMCGKCADECSKSQSKHCQECADVCKCCMDACGLAHSHS